MYGYKEITMNRHMGLLTLARSPPLADTPSFVEQVHFGKDNCPTPTLEPYSLF